MKETELVTLVVKVPKVVFDELKIRVPKGERSEFVREAIMEKLSRSPKPDRMLELEQRIDEVERGLSSMKKLLADLELLTYETMGEIDTYRFCLDAIDKKIIDYLTKRGGATTTELSKSLNLNRWKVWSRLVKIKERSREALGKPIVEFYAGEKGGKKRAWWLTTR